MLQAGDVVAHTGVAYGGWDFMYVWSGGCTFRVIDPDTMDDYDAWSTTVAPKSIDEAIDVATRHARMVYDECFNLQDADHQEY